MATEVVVAMLGLVSQWQYLVTVEPVVLVIRYIVVLAVQQRLMAASPEMYCWVGFAVIVSS